MDKRKRLPETRSPRHRLSVTVELEDGRGRCRDLSNSGMFFEIDDSIETGATIRVSLILNDVHPMPPVQMEASGRFVRVERLERKSGVRSSSRRCASRTQKPGQRSGPSRPGEFGQRARSAECGGFPRSLPTSRSR